MLNNNLLGNKLNFFRNKQTNPEIKEPLKPVPITHAISGFVFVIRSVIFLLRAFAMGFALKAIFHTDWTIWSLFCIGFSLNYIINSIAIFFDKEI